jgi:hypothetical protein
VLGQPCAPIELQPPLDHEVGGSYGNRGQEDQREHADLHEHCVRRALLERVEERAVPIVAPYCQPDLRQREQQQQKRRCAYLAAALAVPVRAGKAHEVAQRRPGRTGTAARMRHQDRSLVTGPMRPI